MRPFSRLLVLILLMLVLLPHPELPANAQDHQYTDWRLVDARDLRDELDQALFAAYPAFASADVERLRGGWSDLLLSPDGSSVIGMRGIRGVVGGERVTQDLLCRYDFDTTSITCRDVAGEEFPAPISAIYAAWKPDGSSLIMYDLVGQDTDLWQLDPLTLSATNLTDDGYGGSWQQGPPSQVAVDYAPSWTPDGDLIFLRMTKPRENWQISVYRLPGGTEKAEKVVELSDDWRNFLALDRAHVALSPDGAWLALIPTGPQPPHTHGVLMVDLAAGTVEQRLPPDALQPELAAWSELRDIPDGEMPLIPQHVIWSGDGQHLIVFSSNTSSLRGREPVDSINVLSIDVQTNAVTPLVDFTQAASADAASEVPITMPGMGILAPDGHTLFYVARIPFTINVVFAVPVAFDASPIAVGAVPDDIYDALRVRMNRAELGQIMQAATNGRVVIGTIC